MNNDINSKIKKAFSDATPDIFDSILSKCNEQKGSAVIMTTNKRNNFKKFVSIAAAIVLVIAGLGVFGVYQSNNAVKSVVALDVNPSIKINLNKNEKVLDVIPLNEDAEKIIGTMDFKNSDLTVTINALVGSMLRNGHLSDIANSILVTVEGDDHSRNEEIQKKLSEEINSILSGSNLQGSVLTQEITQNDEIIALAEKHGISEGKAQLANELSKELNGHTADELADLTINELNILAEKTDKVTSDGVASKKAYIGEDKALEAAFNKAGVSKDNAKYVNIELDSDDGLMVYEVDFIAGNYEYETEVNALNGEIVKHEREASDADDREETNLPVTPDNKPNKENQESNTDNKVPENTVCATAPSSKNNISKDKAKEIALAHAGLSANAIKGYFCKTDIENGVSYYEIEFKANGYEYSYEINASTGKIVDYDKEYDDDYNKPVETTEKADSTRLIGKNKAKDIALTHAGLSANAIKGYSCKTDIENGVSYYEIEFKANGYEYSYEINASTGKIVDYDKEYDDDYNKPVETTEKADSTKLIGKDKAKDIALTHAGLSANDIKGYSCEADKENGVTYYEIEFKANGYEYSYEINATTGKILYSEKEKDN